MTRTFDGLCNVSLLLPHLYQSAAEAIFVERLCRREFCIFLDLDILKIVRKIVAIASRVTVNAPVSAAAVDVHSVFRAQYPLDLYLVHNVLRSQKNVL